MKLTFTLLLASSLSVLGQTLYIPSGTGGIGSSSNGNVGIGNSNPSATFQIGSGTSTLHYGSFGLLLKPNYGDRALIELHSPDGNNKLIFQSLSGASYLGSLSSQPLHIQNQGGDVVMGGNLGVGTGTSITHAKLTIGSETSSLTSAAGIALGSDQNTIELLHSTYGYGYGSKIYGVRMEMA
jgi:hypothetical protein